MADWKKIKAEYIRGGISYRQLAEKYGVSSNAIFRKGKKENWTDLKKQSQRKADAKLVESVATKEAKRVDQFEAIADLLMAKIYQGLLDGTIDADSKRGYRDITGALKDLREIKGIKSDLDLQEQMARIEKLRKEAQEESQEAKDIKVIISGDLENYAK